MRHITVISFVVASLLTGCASNSGVVPSGNNTFSVSRQAASGFSGLGTLKTDAIEEAHQYCLKNNKALHVISATESDPPFILGNFPKADVQFSCVESDIENPKSSDNQEETGERGGDYADLEKLNELRERGIITQEEFDAEKKQILDNN